MEVLKRIYTVTIDIMQTFLMAASIFLVIYIFIVRPFQVSGDSMFPTFKNGEYILTNLISLKLGTEPKRGDVIVFKAPTDEDKDFIKRIIGVPGDMVSIRDGLVFVNGVALDESEYLPSDVKTYAGSFLKEGEPVLIPPDNYFVMGDNRPYSSDSREWGFLPEDEVIGLSFLVYWPVTAMRMIENPYQTAAGAVSYSFNP